MARVLGNWACKICIVSVMGQWIPKILPSVQTFVIAADGACVFCSLGWWCIKRMPTALSLWCWWHQHQRSRSTAEQSWSVMVAQGEEQITCSPARSRAHGCACVCVCVCVCWREMTETICQKGFFASLFLFLLFIKSSEMSFSTYDPRGGGHQLCRPPDEEWQSYDSSTNNNVWCFEVS